MKTLRDYITEVENIQPGDEFDIELAPDQLIESYVVEVSDDYIVIDANDQIISLLEQRGYLGERIARYGPSGSNRTIGFSMGENLDEHGGGIGPEQHWQDLMKEEPVEEGSMKDIDIEHQDYERMTPQQFQAAYGMSREQWAEKNRDLTKPESSDRAHWDFGRMLELAGCGRKMEETAPYEPETDAAHNNPLAAKAADLAPVGADSGPGKVTTVDEAEQEPMDCYEDPTQQETDYVEFGSDNDEDSAEDPIGEAEYQGRKVPLGKPMRGDVKKFKVYVKDPKTGNIKKVNFGHGGTSAKRAGQKTMRIKKSDPARRRSFRARHHCDNPGPRTKARYWSCRAW